MEKEYYCSKCKENIDKKVYEYSKKNCGKVLCRGCQEGFVLKVKDVKKDVEKNGEKSGLSNKQSSYRENMIKGRIAETLIEELFLSLDYDVFRYGMENTVPGIMKLLKGVKGDVATNIRRMPDFVIKKGEDVFFVEVKFRANETFTKKNLPEDYPFLNAYFIVVSKKHIKCITYAELIEGKEVTPASKNYLGSRKEFDLDKEVIIDFCKFAVKFFENV